MQPPARLVCLFSNTVANLQNEILFVRNCLLGFAPGDLLLLNVPLVCAPADRPEEVLRNDPRLSGRLPESLSGIQGHYEQGTVCAARGPKGRDRVSSTAS